METSYDFTLQYLDGGRLLAKRAAELEALGPLKADAAIEHRSLVAGAVMQSVASLDAHIWNIIDRGPGYQLGSNGRQDAAPDLAPFARLLETTSTLDKYAYVLQMLGRGPMPKGSEPHQSAALLVELRNFIVHPKQYPTSKLDQTNFLKRLKDLKWSVPDYGTNGTMNFFPHLCLSAECAHWATRSAAAFLRGFYRALDLQYSREMVQDLLTSWVSRLDLD